MRSLDATVIKQFSFYFLLLVLVIFACASTLSYSASPVISNANLLGINIAAPLDYEEDRLYADAIRSSREFKAGTNENNTTLVATDANGWPTADFSFYVWAGLAKRHGTYTLSFKGQAFVTSNPGSRIYISYDPATNTSSASFKYPNPASGALALRFSNTRRSNDSESGTGVTAIKLMRPRTPGASTSYPVTTLFSDPIKTLVSKFSVIRFMDFLATNANQQKTWSERPLPTWASFNRYSNAKSPTSTNKYGWQGIGAPLEHAILFANETGKNAWINIPVLADDDYVRNVARMLAYGSDGVTPYSSPQANPIYPPLNSNLHVYIEYSNELWNSGGPFPQFHDNCQAASDELVATNGSSPLNWDGIWNKIAYVKGGSNSTWKWSMCWRRPAKRTVEISNIFRKVFGDTAMMTRIRPVMMTQLTASSKMLFDETKMLLDYYNHMAGDFSGAPTAHSPSYYIYGSGGSGYYDPQNPGVASADELFADHGMLPEGYVGKWGPTGFRSSLQADAKYVAAMGVKRIAYEGGPNLETGVNVKNYAVTQTAVNDPRMTTAMVNMHNEWSANSGDLFVYYRATGNAQWGFTSDVNDLGTVKLAAIDALNNADRAPITIGTLVPASIDGNAADICSRGWGCAPIPNHDYFTAESGKLTWASYSFRSTTSIPWTVDISFKNTSRNASVAVYLDGKLVETKSTSGEALSFKAGLVGPGLHGVIVSAVTGKFSPNTISVIQK
jgi:hypothetical protein